MSTARTAGVRTGAAILLVTATLLLLWGHWKPLNQDEVFVLETDSVASLRQLVVVQRHTPISLDPLFYHVLGHASVRVFGPTAFAVRLPSLLGYLLMQVCLFASARLLAGPVAAVIAAAVPALTATLYYGAEARPYGLLLGLAALLLLSWLHAAQANGASRADVPKRSRTGWLCLLAVSLLLLLNTHYFAVLLLLPLYAAELVRTWVRRRARGRLAVDWPVVLAIVGGSAGALLTLPFQPAAAEFRTNYYNAGQVGWHAVTQSYRALVINYTDYPLAVQHVIGGLLLLAAGVLLWRGVQRQLADAVPLPVLVFLSVLAALPFAGFLLARFVTHAIEVRYVLPAILGIALLLALLAASLLRSRREVRLVGVLLLAAIALAGAERLREQRAARTRLMQSLALTPQLQERLKDEPDARLYVQNLGFFDEVTPYVSPDLRARMVLVYSRERELALLHHDTVALTAVHMQQFTQVPTVDYQVLRNELGVHLLLLRPNGWEWLGQQLALEGVHVTPLGQALGGSLVAAYFGPETTQL